jgi:hypothetical protein
LIDVPGGPGNGVASVVSGVLADDDVGGAVTPVESVEPVDSVDSVELLGVGGATVDGGALVDAAAVEPAGLADSVVTPVAELHAATSRATMMPPPARARRQTRGDMARMVRDVSV